MKNSHELGRSMIEMLAVLAIIGVITVSALSGYSQAMMRYKASKTVSEVVTIADDVYKLYAWRRTYPESIPCSAWAKEEIIPSNTKGECTNPFGGEYKLSGVPKTTKTEDRCLQIEVTGLSHAVCEQIADEIWSGLTLCKNQECTGCADGATSGCTFTITVQ